MGKNKKKSKTNVLTTSAAAGKSASPADSIEDQGNSKEVESLEQKLVESHPLKKTAKEYTMRACLYDFQYGRDFKETRPHAKAQYHIIRNFDKAVREPTFYDKVEKDDIVVFLQSEDLVVSCEEVVYHMVIKWVKHRQLQRLKYLEELLELVRFPQLELDFLGQEVVKEHIVLDTNVGQLLLHEAFEYHQKKLENEQDIKVS